MVETSETDNERISPFESGLWGHWTNLERFSWLRSFLKQINDAPDTYYIELKLERDKVDKLTEAVGILESVIKEELAILEKRIAYNEAMSELAMDYVLKKASPVRLALPTGLKPKRNEGN